MLCVISIALLFVGAAGCIGGDPVVGTWETKPVLGFYVVVEFSGDGNGVVTTKSDLTSSEASTNFKWEKTEDKTYKITGSDSRFSAGTYTLSDDGKTLTGPLGIQLNKA